MNRDAVEDCLRRRRETAHELADDGVDRTTTALANAAADNLPALLREEITYATEQRDALDDETREPWQVLIDIDQEALESL